jgi:hypothetical protein
MLTVQDIRGVYVLPPTPCKEGMGGWDAVDTVDLDPFSAPPTGGVRLRIVTARA